MGVGVGVGVGGLDGVVVFTDATLGRQLIVIMHGMLYIVYWGYIHVYVYTAISCCNLFCSFHIECDSSPSSSPDPLH